MGKQQNQENLETVEEMLSQLHGAPNDDTVSQLMDVYESIERSYRAAAMAGEAAPHVSNSANF
jgi:DTW domain-containing protein YfiP